MKTDAALRKALHENVKDSTIILVAQRISTILHAEQILVLDDSKIVIINGTHIVYIIVFCRSSTRSLSLSLCGRVVARRRGGAIDSFRFHFRRSIRVGIRPGSTGGIGRVEVVFHRYDITVVVIVTQQNYCVLQLERLSCGRSYLRN